MSGWRRRVSANVALIVREPLGVIGAILPWNFPIQMAAWKLGPILATGNSVVVKPARQTSLSALRLAELAAEAGVPAGVFNVVPGNGSTIGAALCKHMDVDAVAFTGSTDVGRQLLEYSAQSNLKRVVLELGGKNPQVVLEDAGDLDYIAAQVVNCVFWNMGENCSSGSRLIVHRRFKGRFARTHAEGQPGMEGRRSARSQYEDRADDRGEPPEEGARVHRERAAGRGDRRTGRSAHAAGNGRVLCGSDHLRQCSALHANRAARRFSARCFPC